MHRQGGTVAGPGGAKVDIPAGALATDVTLQIEQTTAGAPALPTDLTATGPMFAFTPHGTTFALPVTMTMPFDPAGVPAGATPQFYKTNAQNEWEQVANATFGANAVVAEITSFSFGQVVIPPLQRNEPEREWDFSVYPRSGGARVTLPAPDEGGSERGHYGPQTAGRHRTGSNRPGNSGETSGKTTPGRPEGLPDAQLSLED